MGSVLRSHRILQYRSCEYSDFMLKQGRVLFGSNLFVSHIVHVVMVKCCLSGLHLGTRHTKNATQMNRSTFKSRWMTLLEWIWSRQSKTWAMQRLFTAEIFKRSRIFEMLQWKCMGYKPQHLPGVRLRVKFARDDVFEQFAARHAE